MARKGDIMALSAVSSSSSSSILDDGLVATLLGNTRQTASIGISSASTAGGSASGSSTDTLAQDMVAILKALALGDGTGAKTGLAKLKADLKAGTTQDGPSLTADVTSLFKDLVSGNASAANTDISKLQADLKAEHSFSSASPLETLVSKISDALSSGSLHGALKDLTAYLVQNGQSTGSLVNTSA